MKFTYLLLGCALGLSAQAGSLSTNASSDTPGFAAATLATVDSFEFETAPYYTRIAVVAHQTTVKLKRHEISKAKAVATNAKLKKAKALLDTAVKACAPFSMTGKCSKDEARAESLMSAAATVLASI